MTLLTLEYEIIFHNVTASINDNNNSNNNDDDHDNTGVECYSFTDWQRGPMSLS